MAVQDLKHTGSYEDPRQDVCRNLCGPKAWSQSKNVYSLGLLHKIQTVTWTFLKLFAAGVKRASASFFFLTFFSCNATMKKWVGVDSLRVDLKNIEVPIW